MGQTSYVRNDMEANFRREVWAAKGKALVGGPGGRIPLAALGKGTFRGLEILLRRPSFCFIVFSGEEPNVQMDKTTYDKNSIRTPNLSFRIAIYLFVRNKF
jgi:hypothetical protein